MVEKIKRDVRITTIYEGTSEIMEMTICRDRWQNHLKTRGQHYHDEASTLRALHAEHPSVGANAAALGLQALAVIMERAREQRLTRNQHVLFRLGELIARAEGAASFARRAANAAQGTLNEKSDTRFDAEALATFSRICARESALTIASEGMRWVYGADGVPADAMDAFERSLQLSEIHREQAGLVADMDAAADVLYERTQL